MLSRVVYSLDRRSNPNEAKTSTESNLRNRFTKSTLDAAIIQRTTPAIKELWTWAALSIMSVNNVAFVSSRNYRNLPPHVFLPVRDGALTLSSSSSFILSCSYF